MEWIIIAWLAVVTVLIRHNMIVTAMVVCRVKAWLRYKGE